MTDLLIGAADNYSWDQIRNWAKSIRRSGFEGKVILLCYRITDPRISEECRKLDIDVYLCDSDNFGNPIKHNDRGRDTQSHQMRFFHMWQLLNTPTYKDKFDYVIATDVRDVIFQANPSDWLLDYGLKWILAPSEGIAYRNEPWGADNLQRGYGPLVWDSMKDETIFNVGTIAGPARLMVPLFLSIFSMGEGRYIPNDQSTFNVLVRGILYEVSAYASMELGWAAQCGTTLDPQKIEMLKPHLTESPPVIKNGLVYTTAGQLFSLVHQYDRVPELNEIINKRYA